jgi:hypothetical protein
MNICVELREMESEPGGADFDLVQLVRLGAFEPLSVLRRKSHIET